MNRNDVERYLAIDRHIEKMNYQEILHMGCSLDLVGAEKWPEGLPFKPDVWEDIGERERVEWLVSIQCLIEMRVGKKALMRYRCKLEEGWTDQQFEDWWESNQTRRLTEELEDRYHRSQNRGDGRDNGDDVGDFSVTHAFLRKSRAFALAALGFSCTALAFSLAALALRLVMAFFLH